LLRAQLAANVEFRSTLRKLRDLHLPDNETLQLRVHSAELLATASKHREAVEEFEDAVKMSGRDENLVYDLAIEQYSSGEYLSALATVQTLKQQHDSAEIEDLAADIEEQTGNTQEALRDHENAVANAPNDERYRLSLGTALLKYREYTKAAEVFRKAADLFPESARVYAGSGMADYLQEEYDDSVSAFLRADQLEAGAGRVLNYLGATQADSPAGPSSTAIIAVCSRADSHRADSAAFTWCGVLRFRKAYIAGDRVAAREINSELRKAATLDPADPVATCWLGRALAWTEQLADARRWLEACVRLRPEIAEDHYQLSRVYVAMGLKQLAARQAALTTKLNAERQQNDALADRFAREMLSSNSNRQK
jgi:Flp pilus assembly protein TadD